MTGLSFDDKKYFFYQYDVASVATTFIYGKLSDRIPGRGGISTSGSSTTVTSVTADPGSPFVAAFDFVNVGDLLWIQTSDTAWAERVVTAKASNTSITVNTAINLGAAGRTSWEIQQFKSGTTINDGWVNIRDVLEKSVQCTVDTLNATSVTVSVEVRNVAGPSSNYQIATNVFSTVGSKTFAIIEPYNQIRVGAYVTGDAGVQSLTAVFKGVAAPAWGGR